MKEYPSMSESDLAQEPEGEPLKTADLRGKKNRFKKWLNYDPDSPNIAGWGIERAFMELIQNWFVAQDSMRVKADAK